GDKQVFEDATTYICILTLNKKSQEHFTFTDITDLTQWMAIKVAPSAVLSAPAVSISEWIFSAGLTKTFDKLAHMRIKLMDVADKIFVGVQTSADSVFVMRKLEQGDREVVVYSKALEKQYRIESEILLPLL